MILHFNVKGDVRKAMVRAVEEETGSRAHYLGMPSAAYEIGDYTVGKNGELSFPDGTDLEGSSAVIDACVMATGVSPEEWEQNREEEDMSEQKGMAIQMPMMSGDEISRLEQLIASKESLIRKAVGADSLAVGEKDGKLDFAWFREDAEPDEVKAYMDLVTALCKTAKSAKRITGKDKPVENEKYAFRCFLLRLGFIGDEFKASRKVLLKNFSGSSAFKGGAKHEISE
jgi:hypothetical protein